ncbi:uncharacterized protein LOC124529779 [Vanessa cardui]|uniref:uncharacterized protein LOC124529779 n=1 Tax=Vanessa cardui TaxID=171605 RepID=UPI001F131C8F|nr:uncharacterized protein LOC124529779 [Vanessa cardui]
MSSDHEADTPPVTPPKRRRPKKASKRRRRRNSSSSSSSADESSPRRTRKLSSRLTSRDVLKLLSKWKGESTKNNFSSNNNFNNVIPEFDPSCRTQTIDCWLRKVNECASIYGWEDKQTIHYSLQKLIGLAKKWFESLQTVKFTWDEWQLKLRKAFPSDENYGRLLEEMLNRTSRNDESLREYFYDKLGLLSMCEITGKKAVDCIVYGISDRSVRNGAQALDSTEPEDLLTYLSSQKPQQAMSYNNRPRERTFQKPNNSANTNTGASNSNLNSVICYNCRVKGHPYFKCTKPLTICKRCNRVGHDNDRCRLDSLTSTNLSSSKLSQSMTILSKPT